MKNRLARLLVRLGISADFLTAAGVLLSFYAAWLIALENLFAAGGVLLLSGLCDMLDGAVARESAKQSAFGGILDSSLDRYGDGVVLGAVIIYYINFSQVQYAVLAVSALLGSFAISYVRARAECETDDCRVGFWERGERLVLIALALLVNHLTAALWVLGVGTHWTVFRRLAFAKIKIKNPSSKKIPFYLRASGRNTWPYFFKAAAIVGLVLFLPR